MKTSERKEAELEPYRVLRRRRTEGIVLLGAMIPLLIFAGLESEEIKKYYYDHALAMSVALLLYSVVHVIILNRISASRCPNCKEKYFHRYFVSIPFVNSCRHCGQSIHGKQKTNI